MNNPYAPPSPEQGADKTSWKSKRSLFLILSARFTLIICAIAVVRTIPNRTDFYDFLGFLVAMLSLLFFTMVVVLDLHKQGK